MNLSKVEELGEQWNSDVLTNFARSLSVNATSANAGELIGNRMFYANDYMVCRAVTPMSKVTQKLPGYSRFWLCHLCQDVLDKNSKYRVHELGECEIFIFRHDLRTYA
jgi:hypothetical protein